MGSKSSDTACGTCGYVSLSIDIAARNYTLVLGFDVPFGGAGYNKAGIQIRMSDGATDKHGREDGHGVSSTGVVTDIESLMTVYHGTA